MTPLLFSLNKLLIYIFQYTIFLVMMKKTRIEYNIDYDNTKNTST
jgi:hypothetical protein